MIGKSSSVVNSSLGSKHMPTGLKSALEDALKMDNYIKSRSLKS
jgi:hypothetical protein